MLRPFSTDKASLKEAFQRIKIAGDFNDMSHIEDLEEAVGPLLRAMVIREKFDRRNSICPLGLRLSFSLSPDRYMFFSLQSFPTTVAKFLNKTLEQEDQSRRVSSTIRPNTGWHSVPFSLSPSSSSSSLITSVIPFSYFTELRFSFAYAHSYFIACAFYFCLSFSLRFLGFGLPWPLRFYLDHRLKTTTACPSGQTPPKQTVNLVQSRTSPPTLSPPVDKNAPTKTAANAHGTYRFLFRHRWEKTHGNRSSSALRWWLVRWIQLSSSSSDRLTHSNLFAVSACVFAVESASLLSPIDKQST